MANGGDDTAQGETTGVVKKRLTERTKIEGHDVAASPGNPEYLVVSDKSGASPGCAAQGQQITDHRNRCGWFILSC